MVLSEHRKQQKYQWDVENTQKISVKFTKKIDGDLLDILNSSPNKAGLIKTALRYYKDNVINKTPQQ